MRADLFWLSDDQWRQIEPHLRTDVRGKDRVDDRRVISGIPQSDPRHRSREPRSETQFASWLPAACCSCQSAAPAPARLWNAARTLGPRVRRRLKSLFGKTRLREEPMVPS